MLGLCRQSRHSGGAGGRSGPQGGLEPDHRDLAQYRRDARQPHGLPVDPRDLLVLVLRGDVPVAVFPGYAREVLGGDEHAVTLLLAVFSVGIGIGSLLCEKLSGRHVEIGLVPFGSIGLTLFGLDLWWASPATVATAANAAPLSIGALLSNRRAGGCSSTW